MTLIARKTPIRKIFRWSQWALLSCGILLLGYCGLVLGDAWRFQRRESRDLDWLLRDRPAATEAKALPESPSISKSAPVTPVDGLIGRIEISRLLFSALVVEGADRGTLRRAVGHIPGTALPGEAGNVGLSGHRDTFFRPLKNVKIGDEVRISTPRGVFQYEVVSLRVVDPENVSVLASSDEHVLTLVTCYPFYFVGPAPRRWIVWARQVSATAAAPAGIE